MPSSYNRDVTSVAQRRRQRGYRVTAEWGTGALRTNGIDAIEAVGAGSYRTMTDANNCSQIETVMVEEPAAIEATVVMLHP